MGNTLDNHRAGIEPRAHPHGRGEHAAIPWARAHKEGSSPRAWGTPYPKRGRAISTGLIPTGVGNTCGVRQRLRSASAHPHGRGEHRSVDNVGPVKKGSSPRAWGTRQVFCGAHACLWLIPTGVGNTPETPGLTRPSRAHPHGRGEHIKSAIGVFVEWGSSPRAWGTHFSYRVAPQGAGLIPTGVGNTQLGRQNPGRVGAHPHGRGEHDNAQAVAQELRGSSPRAWGTHRGNHLLVLRQRLIPTGVGNTYIRVALLRPWRAHPHGRGEHSGLVSTSSIFSGSSPRAWGTLASACVIAWTMGLIPTGVGNTST